MNQRLSIITLGVRDLAAATEFYVNKFSWIKSKHSTEGISFFHLNGIMLGLYPMAEFEKEIEGIELATEGRNRITLAYLAKSEQEVDDLFVSFKANEVQILKQPKKVFWGGYSGYISDLDGNLWEIAYNPFIEIGEDGNLKG